jgi:L-threonylcarbamoyladenylate synthase
MASAAQHLIAGDLVAFPTETVYGLGADACNSQAVSRIYSVKGRPNDHPLIVHIASIDRIGDWATDIPEYAIALARNFWPGPMTLVLKRSQLAGDFVTAGQDTVGVRVPDHVVALALLEAFEKVGGKGVAAPSANRFGHISPTTASAVIEEVGEYLSKSDLVLDGGACDVGVESTIIECTGRIPRVLRPGAVTEIEILKVAQALNTDVVTSKTKVSGNLQSHYKPRARVVVNQIPRNGQGFLALSNIPTPDGLIRLAVPNSATEYAQILYEAFRKADKMGLFEILVVLPKGSGIELAILDRVTKAAY